jgi:YD repeat-containing protein
MSSVEHWALVNGVLTNQSDQGVTYYYDSNPFAPTYSQNASGRLTAVAFNAAFWPMYYMYSYNAAGRVTGQRLTVSTSGYAMNAAYEWNNEGQMTTQAYPASGPVLRYQYDNLSRPSAMTQDGVTGMVATSGYDTLGRLSTLTYFGSTETRQYNSLNQLTGMTVAGMMDMEYRYPVGQNNGRISESIDHVTGEDVTYTYDALNRLIQAETAGAGWGQAFAYDGFGNLTSKTATKGTPPLWAATYDQGTNRQAGVAYDANGNPQLTMANGQAGFPYDVENRIVNQTLSTGAVQWSYDPGGKRVRKVSGATQDANTYFDVYFYGITGQKLMTFNCHSVGGVGMVCDTTGTRIYFAGKLVKSDGAVVVTDGLGSVRANSNGERMSY